jgi:hypothetical protein
MSGSSTLPENVIEIPSVSSEIAPAPQKASVIAEYMAEIGRKGGLKGGKARAKRLSKKRLREIGRKAANARWSKPKKAS